MFLLLKDYKKKSIASHLFFTSKATKYVVPKNTTTHKDGSHVCLFL